LRDLEIYIRDVDVAALAQWLSSHLDDLALPDQLSDDKPVKVRAFYCGASIGLSLYPRAGGKRYASMIIEGDELPWSSDLDCARSAWQAMATEIRCSPGEWKEGEPVDDERWWRIDERGEQLAVWN
jgi:hypothetical protein